MICIQTEGRTNGRTDGHGETSIPSYNFVAGGIITIFGHFQREATFWLFQERQRIHYTLVALLGGGYPELSTHLRLFPLRALA